MNRNTRTFIWGFILAILGTLFIIKDLNHLEAAHWKLSWYYIYLLLDIRIFLWAGLNKIEKTTD